MKYRHQLINYLIEKNKYKTYLEIGIENPILNFNHINVTYKYGVDPVPVSLSVEEYFEGTSDKFFFQNTDLFDIIFIDGLHESNQVYRDIEHSFKALSPGGTIVMHDCLPRNEVEQIVPRQQDVWTGDVWKAFVRFREDNSDVEMRVVNMDMGCGILTKSEKDLYFEAQTELTYRNFQEYYKEWLNVISVDNFLKEEGNA